MKFLNFEHEVRLLGPWKELTLPLNPLCRPFTPQATQAHNREDCWDFLIYQISIITIFVGIEKAKWRKLLVTRTLWPYNKWKRKPASIWSR